MKLRLLKEDYKSNFNGLYKAFVSGTLNNFLSDKSPIDIPNLPPFPIYMAKSDDSIRTQKFYKAFDTISEYYLNLDRAILLDKRFWDSLFITTFREYILTEYPQLKINKNYKKSYDAFKKIVVRDFDWENYVYKTLILVEYLHDYRDKSEHHRYLELVLNNFDLFNYIIKYSLTQNGEFLLNILDIIDEEDLSQKLKKRIPNRPDLGKDERYGRRVIYEFNKNYPVMMFPTMSKEEIKFYFIEFLELYLNH